MAPLRIEDIIYLDWEVTTSNFLFNLPAYIYIFIYIYLTFSVKSTITISIYIICFSKLYVFYYTIYKNKDLLINKYILTNLHIYRLIKDIPENDRKGIFVTQQNSCINTSHCALDWISRFEKLTTPTLFCQLLDDRSPYISQMIYYRYIVCYQSVEHVQLCLFFSV